MTAQLDYSSRKGSLSVERFATIHKDRSIVGYVSSVNLEYKKYTSKSISILDINADIIFQIEIENKPNYYLIETAYNGQQYAFLFLDVVTRRLELKLYDVNGKLVREFPRTLTNKDIEYFLAHVTHNNNYTGYNQFLQELNQHGFLLMLHSVESNLNTCQIFKITADSSQERFYTFMTEGPIYETNFLGRSKSQIYLSFEIDGKTKGQFFTECLGINIESFQSVFEIKQLKDQDYFFFPKLALTNDTSDKVKLVGYFFEAEKNMENEQLVEHVFD